MRAKELPLLLIHHTTDANLEFLQKGTENELAHTLNYSACATSCNTPPPFPFPFPWRWATPPVQAATQPSLSDLAARSTGMLATAMALARRRRKRWTKLLGRLPTIAHSTCAVPRGTHHEVGDASPHGYDRVLTMGPTRSVAPARERLNFGVRGRVVACNDILAERRDPCVRLRFGR